MVFTYFFFKEIDSQHNTHFLSHTTGDFGDSFTVKWGNEHRSGLKGNLRQKSNTKTGKKRTALMHRILRLTLDVCETERVSS